jgi:hypothetical protein
MSLTKKEAETQNVGVDQPEQLEFIKGSIAELLGAVTVKRFVTPWHFRILDAHGDLLREFTIRGDGSTTIGRSGDVSKMYVFPFTASVVDANGHEARVRINAESAGPIEFAKAV